MNVVSYIFLSLIILFSGIICAENDHSNEIAQIKIAQVQAEPGNTVDVPVTITGMGNFTTFMLYIVFDDDLLYCNTSEGHGVVNLHPVIASAFVNKLNDTTLVVARYGPVVAIPNGDKLFDLRFQFCNEALICEENEYIAAITIYEIQPYQSFFAIRQDGSTELIPVNFINGSVSKDLYSLSFIIKDSETGINIDSASINLNGTQYNAGVYYFEGIPPGNYEYHIQKAGYLEATGTVFLDGDTTVNVTLVSDSEEIPADELLKGIIISNNETFCYNATNSITTGGDEEENYFVVQEGGEALLIAGNNITMLPGTRVESGAYLHAFITEDDEYCDIFQYKNIEYNLPEDIDIKGSVSYENVSDLFFKAYPNPVTHEITVEVSGNFSEDIMTIEVFSIMGNKLMQIESPVQKQYVISLNDYPSGIYLMRLTIGRQSAYTRIIKR